MFLKFCKFDTCDSYKNNSRNKKTMYNAMVMRPVFRDFSGGGSPLGIAI